MTYTTTFITRLWKTFQPKFSFKKQKQHFFFGCLLLSFCLLFPNFSFGQYTAIPDANFEQKLIDLGIDTEGAPTDGQILTADAEAKTGALNINSSSISDLTGIEAFTNVTQLHCHSNQLTSLDVSQNIALTYLNCHSNQLTSLDVSLNTVLFTLYCQSNQLTSLDVSQNTALTFFSCTSNQLTSLDVSLNSTLKDLRCNSNQLTSLDVRNGNNSNFTYFNATNNSLTCISVDDPAYSTANWTNIDAGVVFSPGCDTYTAIPDANFEQKLIDLGIDSDGAPTDGWILTADAEAVTGILNVTSSNISDLTGIQAFINMTKLQCGSNQLTSLDLSQNTALNDLHCPSNQLTSLDVSQNTALIYLICRSNQLTSLDVTLNTSLARLLCQNNQLTSLDISQNTVLNYLTCQNNLLTDLDVRNGNNTNFITFNSTINSLTCISVDNPTYSTANWTDIDPGVVFDMNCLNALPIELLYIRGEALDQNNLITWATASEENTASHFLEYSNGVEGWKVIGQMDAAGFSSQTTYYEFLDHSPTPVGYYRLKSVDFDGTFQISTTIAIERESDHFELLNVYPNPTKSILGINFNLANKSLITVTLTDLSGRMVAVLNHDGTAGVNRINFDLSQFNAGMYLVQIDNGREKLQRRIVKQ